MIVIEEKITHNLSSELSEYVITIISSNTFNNIENRKYSKVIQLRSTLRMNIVPELKTLSWLFWVWTFYFRLSDKLEFVLCNYLLMQTQSKSNPWQKKLKPKKLKNSDSVTKTSIF